MPNNSFFQICFFTDILSCKKAHLLVSLMVFCFFSDVLMFAQSVEPSAKKDSSLLDQYIQTKNASTIIVFDSSNIKQFWVDHSVCSDKNTIKISLNQEGSLFRSVPLKIQLANVNETQDCKVEVISDSSDIAFSVLDEKFNKLSSSSKENPFIDYTVTSSTFHLEYAQNHVFNLKFSAQDVSELSIKKIILSFLKNKNSSYLLSPGTLKITHDNTTPLGNIIKKESINTDMIALTGTESQLHSRNKIILSDKPCLFHAKVKNIGDKPTGIYFGYNTFAQNGKRLDYRCNPFKENKILTVVSSTDNSNKLTVNGSAEWIKGCVLAIDAKKDLSDFPNFNYTEGTIQDIRKIDDQNYEIIFDKTIKRIPEGTHVRIQQRQGEYYLYLKYQILQPNEEIEFKSEIRKEDSKFQYSNAAFCKGTYCVVPLIMSYSVNAGDKNTILISDFSITY